MVVFGDHGLSEASTRISQGFQAGHGNSWRSRSISTFPPWPGRKGFHVDLSCFGNSSTSSGNTWREGSFCDNLPCLSWELRTSNVCPAWAVSEKLSMLLLLFILSLPDTLLLLLVSVNIPICIFQPTSPLHPSLLFFLIFVPIFAPYQPFSPVTWTGKIFPKTLFGDLEKGDSDCRFYIIHIAEPTPPSWEVQRAGAVQELQCRQGETGSVSLHFFMIYFWLSSCLLHRWL